MGNLRLVLAVKPTDVVDDVLIKSSAGVEGPAVWQQ